MKIKAITRVVTIEFTDDELEFIIDKLRDSADQSAINLARALKEHLDDQVKA